MNTKRTVFFTALATLTVIFVTENPILFGFCQNIEIYNEVMKRCVEGGFFSEHILQLGGFLALSFLILSLITYKMKEEVFQAWWRFARWWVLVIIAVTLFLQNAGGGGGIGISGAVGGAFDALILGIFYAILVITSLVKIVRAYLRTKN